MEINLKKIEIEKLIPHESTLEEHFKELLQQIKQDGFLMRPIVVSQLDKFGKPGFYLIHDGHHRTRVLRTLGCQFIVANVIEFFSKEIKVFYYSNPENELLKEKVISLALNNKDLKPRQTRHCLLVKDKLLPFTDNDYIEPKIYFPLDKLK